MRQALTFIVVITVCSALIACQRWVGISSQELVKRLGQPVNIVPSGDTSIYTYFDGLGGAPMKFYIDKNGVVTKWDATPVSTEFGTPDDSVTVTPIP